MTISGRSSRGSLIDKIADRPRYRIDCVTDLALRMCPMWHLEYVSDGIIDI